MKLIGNKLFSHRHYSITEWQMSTILLPIGYINNMKIFAERLKELREEKNMSLKELGKEIGVSDSAVSRWENEIRVPNIEVLVIIAEYFGVSTDYLVGLED